MDDFYGPDVFFLSQWDVPKKQQRKPSFHTDSSNLHWSAFTCLQGLDASAWLLFNNTRGHSWICWIVRVAIPFSFTLVAFCCHTGPEPKRIEWSWNILKIYLLYFISGQTQSTQMPNSQSVQGSAPKKGKPSKSAIGFYCLQVEKVRNHSEKNRFRQFKALPFARNWSQWWWPWTRSWVFSGKPVDKINKSDASWGCSDTVRRSIFVWVFCILSCSTVCKTANIKLIEHRP